MKKFLIGSCIMIIYCTLTVSANGNILTQKDLPEITLCKKYKKSVGQIKRCQKSVFILKQPTIKVKGIVTNFHNNKNKNGVLWIKTSNGYSIGCVTDINETKFDNITIGDYVIMQGKIKDLLKFKTEKYNSLMLAKGCEVIQ